MSAELLVGNWKLVSWQVVSEDGARDLFGSKPKGSLILTREGRAMALTTAEHRTPGETEPERAALYTSMVAYTGKYRVEGEEFITTVDASWNEKWNERSRGGVSRLMATGSSSSRPLLRAFCFRAKLIFARSSGNESGKAQIVR